MLEDEEGMLSGIDAVSVSWGVTFCVMIPGIRRIEARHTRSPAAAPCSQFLPFPVLRSLLKREPVRIIGLHSGDFFR